MQQLIETLILSILTGLAILGYNKASQPDFILGDWQNAIIEIAGSDKYLHWILTPLFLCPYCMSSVWTIVAHLTLAESFNPVFVILGIFAACGTVTLKPE